MDAMVADSDTYYLLLLLIWCDASTGPAGSLRSPNCNYSRRSDRRSPSVERNIIPGLERVSSF